MSNEYWATFTFKIKIEFMFLQLSHTKTDVFQQSQNLAIECYRVTRTFPSDEKFAMVQQIRRAALSVHLNIAEGCSRKSLVERKRFFEISRGSVIEIDAAIGIAYRLEYCDMKTIENLGNHIISCFKQLTGMIKG
jgi:four helix bundle protein